ncbi:hypothetical protein IEO21_07719 [Rhodonia placenta]|uniref:Uncharacterized protein n=1 Tax=Rhodonia placenta TaxID=104341 RepID=A0A8H7NXK4_9APHY|nr:hypothetical protein IEO21_07719 [Postia placenta]
MITATVQPAT